MSNKPLKRSAQILPLSREHHYTLLFCWKLRQGIKYSITHKRIIKYIDYFFHSFILPHFKEEENTLFCLLKDAKVERALEEHAAIKKLVEDILHSAETAGYTAIGQLANLVDNHTRYEERELFPYIEQHISMEQLEEAGKKLAASEILTDNFEDEFWVNK